MTSCIHVATVAILHFGGQLVAVVGTSMDYYSTLNGPDKERYRRKLLALHGDSEESPNLDPYNISKESWTDDPTLWPPLEYPSIYAYLVDTPGEFTREKLKAFKSLEAYNYYSRQAWYRK